MKFFSEFIWLLRRINKVSTELDNKKVFIENRNSPIDTSNIKDGSLWFKVWTSNDHNAVPDN